MGAVPGEPAAAGQRALHWPASGCTPLLPCRASPTLRPSRHPPFPPSSPRLYLPLTVTTCSNFLTEEECDHIVALAKPHLERSGVVDTATGGSEISDIRTSKGMFLERGHDDTVAAIEERIARWTLLPVGNGEGLQVLVSALGACGLEHGSGGRGATACSWGRGQGAGQRLGWPTRRPPPRSANGSGGVLASRRRAPNPPPLCPPPPPPAELPPGGEVRW